MQLYRDQGVVLRTWKLGEADRIVVLDFGQKLVEGKPAEIRANPAVQEAYLGGVS